MRPVGSDFLLDRGGGSPKREGLPGDAVVASDPDSQEAQRTRGSNARMKRQRLDWAISALQRVGDERGHRYVERAAADRDSATRAAAERELEAWPDSPD
jgi:hypothetical protein